MNDFECNICGNVNNNISFVCEEKQFNTMEKFEYVRCSFCGCIQIVNKPIDMNCYYPSNYYSYNIEYNSKNIKEYILSKFYKYMMNEYNILGFIVSLFYSKSWLKRGLVTRTSKILDVGCGNGYLLKQMYYSGFENLNGCDPFNKNEISLDNKIVIYNKSIFDICDKYDFIMLHHSYEHMDEPLRVLYRLSEMLNENGVIVIRIPLSDSYAWRKYGINWYQIDAPRHFYLHTVKSIRLLTEQVGLSIIDIVYDSGVMQFVESEKYELNISFLSQMPSFLKRKIRTFKKKSAELNKLNDGDQACFYLKKV